MLIENKLIKIFERVYLELACRYGLPVVLNWEIWLGYKPNKKDLFTRFNEELAREGFKTFTWEEFKQFIDKLREIFGNKVWVSREGTKTGIEPITIAIYEPLT